MATDRPPTLDCRREFDVSQDDDVTDLGEIVVVGQRRPPGSTGPYGASGPSGPPTEQQDVSEYPNQGVDGPAPNPCATPEGAREWNADAAAARAKKEFERLAAERGDDGLYSRE